MDLFAFELVEKEVLMVLFTWTRFGGIIGPVDSTELVLSLAELFWGQAVMDS